MAFLGDLVPVLEDRIYVGAQAREQVDAQPQGFDSLEEFPLRRETRAFDDPRRVQENLQRPRPGNLRVELTQRACRRVARIGKYRLARALAVRIELGESGLGKNHL